VRRRSGVIPTEYSKPSIIHYQAKAILALSKTKSPHPSRKVSISAICKNSTLHAIC
jgi:hypothetical protein